ETLRTSAAPGASAVAGVGASVKAALPVRPAAVTFSVSDPTLRTVTWRMALRETLTSPKATAGGLTSISGATALPRSATWAGAADASSTSQAAPVPARAGAYRTVTACQVPGASVKPPGVIRENSELAGDTLGASTVSETSPLLTSVKERSRVRPARTLLKASATGSSRSAEDTPLPVSAASSGGMSAPAMSRLARSVPTSPGPYRAATGACAPAASTRGQG